MVVCAKTRLSRQRYRSPSVGGIKPFAAEILSLTVVALGWVLPARGQTQTPTPNWQTQVRQLAEAKDWKSAMRIVEQEIARAPQDMDVRAWRTRVLAWSGQLAEGENEYREILKTGPI